MSEEHLLMRLIYGLLFLLEESIGCRLLVIVALRVLILVLGLCKSRSLGLRNQYIHNFSIIGGLLFLQLKKDY